MAKEDIKYNISIQQALKEAFGSPSAPLLYLTKSGLKASKIEGYSVNSIEDSEEYLQSYLGTPLMFPMTLKAGIYNFFDKGILSQVEMSDFRMPSTTMVDFKRSKIIKTTNLSAGNGTIKEMYGFSDWQINIRGLLLADPDHPQEAELVEQKKILKQWEEAADSIEVEGSLFADLDIYNIVIKDITFSQLQGKPFIVPFQITAMSDEPTELI